MTHPITPPPELVQQWVDTIYQQTEDDDQRDLYVATRAAQYGADQELEACVQTLKDQSWYNVADDLRAARRPKPPNLKEQALALIDLIQGNKTMWQLNDLDVVRKALEQLPND